RWLAALLLAQMVFGPIANFALLDDATQAAGGFLVNAASHASSLATAALLSIALAVISAGIAIVLWPVLRERSERMSLALAMLGAAGIALSGLENTGLLSMLSLSQAYAAVGAPDGVLFEALREVVRAQRNWSHLIDLLAGGGMLVLMYAALFRFTLVPRWLAGFGMLAAALQMIAVAKPLYGGWVFFPLVLPLGIANLLLVGWLLWKPGFRTAAIAAG
ncbi:MAG TPA: DUF4386 domain-containing protein, partial [Vicinamibacterales bacterium]|nr:DUF4386 domain-containing protein [Vicinamibacterales bacterium]